MASIEELLRYLEQFMTGHVNQQHSPTPSGGAIPGGALPGGGFAGGGGGGGAVGGGVPQGAAAGGEMPAGPATGNAAQGGPMSGDPMGGVGGQLPPELANATAEQVQEALLQFAAMHPELAPFFTGGNQPADLGSALGQLTGIPAEAFTGFTPALSEFELGNFGGLAADEIGQWSQAQGLDSSFADPLSGVTGVTGEASSLSGTLASTGPSLDGIDGIDGLLSTGSDPSDLTGTLVSHDNVLGDLSGFNTAPGEFGNLDPGTFDPGFAAAPGEFGNLDPGSFDPGFAAAPGFDGLESVDHTLPVADPANPADPTGPDDFTSGPALATDHESPFSDSSADGSDQF